MAGGLGNHCESDNGFAETLEDILGLARKWTVGDTHHTRLALIREKEQQDAKTIQVRARETG